MQWALLLRPVVNLEKEKKVMEFLKWRCDSIGAMRTVAGCSRMP